MYDFDDEQYYEPTEADEIFLEAREKLINSLKGSVKQHLKNVSLENEKLRKQIQKLESKLNESNWSLQQLKKEKSNFAEVARKERLSDLLKDFQVERFMVASSTKYNQKCNKCDDERYVHYKTPLGKDQKELCDCNDDSAIVYEVKSVVVTEFALNDNGSKFRLWYKRNTSGKDEYYTSTNFYELSSDGLSYESLNKHSAIFDSLDACQAYCDWLNKDVDTAKYIYDRVQSNQSVKKEVKSAKAE